MDNKELLEQINKRRRKLKDLDTEIKALEEKKKEASRFISEPAIGDTVYFCGTVVKKFPSCPLGDYAIEVDGDYNKMEWVVPKGTKFIPDNRASLDAAKKPDVTNQEPVAWMSQVKYNGPSNFSSTKEQANIYAQLMKQNGYVMEEVAIPVYRHVERPDAEPVAWMNTHPDDRKPAFHKSVDDAIMYQQGIVLEAAIPIYRHPEAVATVEQQETFVISQSVIDEIKEARAQCETAWMDYCQHGGGDFLKIYSGARIAFDTAVAKIHKIAFQEPLLPGSSNIPPETTIDKPLADFFNAGLGETPGEKNQPRD